MDGSGYGRAFDSFISVFKIAVVLAVFGVWKLVELVIWLVKHLHIHWN